METLNMNLVSHDHRFYSPLAGETNWMETLPGKGSGKGAFKTPHSLGKQIEWKRVEEARAKGFVEDSPLAGETNWMETEKW